MTGRRMVAAEAVAKLDALPGGDQGNPEDDHDTADAILLACVPAPVAAAYQRLVDRSRWWAAG